MVVVLQSNDPVRLSWAQSILEEAGIECLLFDLHTAAIEGSIGAIPRRLVVSEADEPRARRLLDAAIAELRAGAGRD